MSGEAAANDGERALAPPGPVFVDLPRWACAQCGYSVPGTIDEPYEGDGTCPEHPGRPLSIRRATPGQPTVG